MNEFLTEIIGFAVVVVVISAVIAFPIMWLWNWLMPTIFGLTTITVTQAFGLELLCSMLFKTSNVNGKK